jgi:hypothetical protein
VIFARCVLEEVDLHWIIAVHIGNRKEHELEDDQEPETRNGAANVSCLGIIDYQVDYICLD